MANIQRILQKVATVLPKTEGAAGKVTLGAKQLQQIAAKDSKAAKIIQEATKGMTNPTLDIAYKAKSNYSIAGLRLRDGRNIVGQGAVSITNPGSADAVIKYRATVENGKKLAANGFIDAGKPVDAKDISMGFSRKGGMVTADTAIADATRHHVSFNEDAAVDLAKQFDANTFLENYIKGSKNVNQRLQGAWVDLRKALRGQMPTSQTVSYCNEVAKVADFAPIKPKELKLKPFQADIISKTDKVSAEKIQELNKFYKS